MHERYELLGTSFEIVSTSAELSARVHRLLLPFCARSEELTYTHRFVLVYEEGAGSYHLYGERGLLYSSLHCDAVLSFLVSLLNAEAIDGFQGFAAHAGVVADGNAGIALLAASGVGKTTLVAAALMVGLQYVSDEALCVSFNPRRMVPYPKPLQLSPCSRKLVGVRAVDDLGMKTPMSYDELGGDLASPAVELSHLVRLVRRPGPVTLTRVPPSDGVVWLLEFAFNHFKQPKMTFDLAIELSLQCQIWQLEYEDALQAVKVIEARLFPSAE